MPVALLLALAKAGRSIPARMAMIAMTTSSSMRVNACLDFFFIANMIKRDIIKRELIFHKYGRQASDYCAFFSFSLPQEQRFESPTGDRAGPNPEQANLVILADADTKVVIQYSDDLII